MSYSLTYYNNADSFEARNVHRCLFHDPHAEVADVDRTRKRILQIQLLEILTPQNEPRVILAFLNRETAHPTYPFPAEEGFETFIRMKYASIEADGKSL